MAFIHSVEFRKAVVHDGEIKRLYEEMEQQIKTEKDRIILKVNVTCFCIGRNRQWSKYMHFFVIWYSGRMSRRKDFCNQMTSLSKLPSFLFLKLHVTFYKQSNARPKVPWEIAVEETCMTFVLFPIIVQCLAVDQPSSFPGLWASALRSGPAGAVEHQRAGAGADLPQAEKGECVCQPAMHTVSPCP